MSYFVYIIESETNLKWYYGQTGNLDQRIINHNEGKSSYTRNKGPWKLIFKRAFETRSEAIKFEAKLKALRNKSYIKKEFNNYFIRDVTSR